jgi:type IV pilus assembly protein PilE
MNNHQHFSGFHLVEILVAIAIISIITALSFPLYSQYIVLQRRQEAKSMLLKLGVAMEHYQLENNSYRDATLEKLHFSSLIAKNNYQLVLQVKDNDYLLIARPINDQAVKDTLCRSLSLDSRGKTEITGNGRVDECW